MTKDILDTDILSELGKGISITVLNHATSYLDEYGKLTFTSVSVYEQLYGFALKKQRVKSNVFGF